MKITWESNNEMRLQRGGGFSLINYILVLYRKRGSKRGSSGGQCRLQPNTDQVSIYFCVFFSSPFFPEPQPAYSSICVNFNLELFLFILGFGFGFGIPILILISSLVGCNCWIHLLHCTTHVCLTLHFSWLEFTRQLDFHSQFLSFFLVLHLVTQGTQSC